MRGELVTVGGRVCVTGLDLSNWQKAVDHYAVAQAGHVFVIAKATEGLSFRDGWYANNREGTLRAGMAFGAYHWLKPSGSGYDQARAFLDFTQNCRGCTLPATLDAEEAGITNRQCIEWCENVEAATGMTPIVYHGAYTDPQPRDPALFRYSPWIAAYSAGYTVNPDPAALRLPQPGQPWGRWDVWQYTSSARVPGVTTGNCDRNVADAEWFARTIGQASPGQPQEEDDDVSIIAIRSDGSQWECAGVFRKHIPTLEISDGLAFIGVKRVTLAADGSQDWLVDRLTDVATLPAPANGGQLPIGELTVSLTGTARPRG